MPLLGICWATVDSSRAFHELDGLLGDAEWVAEFRDDLLGAGVWRRAPRPGVHVDLFIVEPDTEGRLAANLARFGEGVAAVYLAGPDAGPDRIIGVDPRWGPFAIVEGDSVDGETA
ncbi:MAG TPA: hypothetical protein VJ850_12265 [Candidatus Limnocylindrales bacterium]|nr:hypothetical protein [Candidatus Limnocylindrales bacterium]